MVRKIKKAFLIVFDILFWILLAAMVCLVIYSGYQLHNGALIPTFSGWGYSTIISGSMEPTIPTGSLVIFHEQDTYEVGDIVIYEKGQVTVMHRLTFIEGETAITKGDANNVADSPIRTSSIAGKVIYHIPHLGSISMALRNPPVLITVLLLLAVIGSIEVYQYKRKKRKEFDHEGIQI